MYVFNIFITITRFTTVIDIKIKIFIVIDNSFHYNISKKQSKIELNENDIAFENEKYIFNIKLITQKLESTQLQIQMLKQLLESREAENKTLKINIKLLEEQLRNFR